MVNCTDLLRNCGNVRLGKQYHTIESIPETEAGIYWLNSILQQSRLLELSFRERLRDKSLQQDTQVMKTRLNQKIKTSSGVGLFPNLSFGHNAAKRAAKSSSSTSACSSSGVVSFATS